MLLKLAQENFAEGNQPTQIYNIFIYVYKKTIKDPSNFVKFKELKRLHNKIFSAIEKIPLKKSGESQSNWILKKLYLF